MSVPRTKARTGKRKALSNPVPERAPIVLTVHMSLVVITGFARNMNHIVRGRDDAHLSGIVLGLIGELRALGKVEYISMHHCIQGWSGSHSGAGSLSNG